MALLLLLLLGGGSWLPLLLALHPLRAAALPLPLLQRLLRLLLLEGRNCSGMCHVCRDSLQDGSTRGSGWAAG